MATNIYKNTVIPTYVINLPERRDRLSHIKDQFKGKPEFDLTIVDACRDKIGRIGLWKSIVKIIRLAIENDDDIIIICEDDHQFTEHYSSTYLFDNVIDAGKQGAEVLFGGIANFNNAISISKNRFWVDFIWCTQFSVIYRSFFEKILTEPFSDNDTADSKISEMTGNKMAFCPFISTQKNFGYSDVTNNNNNLTGGGLEERFIQAENRLKLIHKVEEVYNENMI